MIFGSNLKLVFQKPLFMILLSGKQTSSTRKIISLMCCLRFVCLLLAFCRICISIIPLIIVAFYFAHSIDLDSRNWAEQSNETTIWNFEFVRRWRDQLANEPHSVRTRFLSVSHFVHSVVACACVRMPASPVCVCVCRRASVVYVCTYIFFDIYRALSSSTTRPTKTLTVRKIGGKRNRDIHNREIHTLTNASLQYIHIDKPKWGEVCCGWWKEISCIRKTYRRRH